MAAISSRYISEIPSNLVRSTGTLARLSELDSIVVESERRRGQIVRDYITRVQKIKDACQIEKSGAVLLECIENFEENFDGSLTRLYSIREDMTEGEVDLSIRRMVKDSFSLVCSPCKKSLSGWEGPTFLISYPRNFGTKAYVVKWTGWNELSASYVYEQLATFFGDPQKGLGFIPPQALGFDLAQQLQVSADREISALSKEDAAILRGNFGKILGDQEAKGEKIMVSKRILGEDLFDFAMTKYPFLSEAQKQKMFVRFGRLALLDLFLGNTDRFIRVERLSREDDRYGLDTSEANLGNVMLVWQPESEKERSVNVYAIDNGVRADFLKDSEKKAQYDQFLTEVFQDFPSRIDELSAHMVSSSLSALRTQVDDMEENVQEAEKKLEVFRQDLREMAKPAFAAGIEQMAEILKGELLPLWRSDRAEIVKARLQAIDPAYLSFLEERFAIFESSME